MKHKYKTKLSPCFVKLCTSVSTDFHNHLSSENAWEKACKFAFRCAEIKKELNG